MKNEPMLVIPAYSPIVIYELITSLAVGLVLATVSYMVGVYYDPGYQISNLEVIGVVLNYSCVILTARQNIWCWPTGILAVIFLGILFWQLDLYASMALSILYFLPVQFWGWYNWLYGGKDMTTLPVTRLTGMQRVTFIFAIGFAAWIVTSLINGTFGGAFNGYDTAILTISIMAQFLLTFKKLESWVLWIIVNLLSIYVYTSSGAYVLGIQYLFFLFNAFYGLHQWRKTEA